MGMIANYQSTTDIELEKFMCFDDVEEAQENENVEICDIDKMWDALHFLLTGKSAGESVEDNLISEAIVGQFNICFKIKLLQCLCNFFHSITFRSRYKFFDFFPRNIKLPYNRFAD